MTCIEMINSKQKNPREKYIFLEACNFINANFTEPYLR